MIETSMNHCEWQPISAWAPIVGQWTFEEEVVIYNSSQGGSNFPYGLCTSNVDLTEGFIRASVELSATEESSGRILLGYRSANERYISIGLGGYGAAYVLSEYEPSYGWKDLLLVGSVDNLLVNDQYEIETRLQGQRLYLTVNKVRIFRYVLEQPLTSSQVGLFGWGNQPVKFSNIAVNKVSGKVFVVMQFSEPYQQLYSEVLQPVAKEFALQAYHAGENFGSGVVLQDIVAGIIEAKIIIAEVTPVNQNVFYELGYAHALRKPTILLAERGKQLPFDITGYRCLFYENTIGGKKQVEEALRQHLQAILYDE